MCFKIIETAVAFASAETECAGLAEGATMAAPKAAAIMTSLNALNPSGEDVWIGLDDRDTEGTYTFSDGTSFVQTGGTLGSDDVTWSYSFTAWKSGQPHADASKAEAKDCVKIDTTELWGLVDCTKEKNYACQMAPEVVTTTVSSTQASSSVSSTA